MTQGTDITKRNGGETGAPERSRPPQSVLDVFSSESFKRQVAAALPAHISADSMMRIALTEVRMNPDLQKCTVPSFMGALLKAAQAGLRPGMFGEGYLIPRYSRKTRSMEAQFQPGYMGLAQLAYRSGEVSDIVAQAVYAADHFNYQLGTEPRIDHVPDMTTAHTDEDIVAFYAVVRLRNGGRLLKVMRRADVDAIRDRFGPTNRGGTVVGPWATDYAAMGEKTVLIQALKLAPKESERLAAALQADSDALFNDRVAAGVAGGAREPIDIADRIAERIGADDAEPEDDAEPAIEVDPVSGEVTAAETLPGTSESD